MRRTMFLAAWRAPLLELGRMADADRRAKHAEGYVLSFEEIGRKIDEVKALGGVQILMQGGHNPYIPFEWYLDLLRYIKRHHPIHIHAFSPSEVDFFATRFGMTIEQVLREL